MVVMRRKRRGGKKAEEGAGKKGEEGMWREGEIANTLWQLPVDLPLNRNLKYFL